MVGGYCLRISHGRIMFDHDSRLGILFENISRLDVGFELVSWLDGYNLRKSYFGCNFENDS
jgi:hypothetical protein